MPDASPLITLGQFTVPIPVVDVVADEARRPQNDRNGAVKVRWEAKPEYVVEIETIVLKA